MDRRVVLRFRRRIYAFANSRFTSYGLFAAKIKEIGMENKPAQNIQDSFLNSARKERMHVTIYLVSGVKLSGRIRSFDKYSVVLETNNQEQLIFKHAISTVAMGRNSHSHADRAAAHASSGGHEAEPVSDPAGTEG
jgi:host factor-I protein